MVFRALIFVLQELAQVRTRFYSPLKKRFPLRMPEVSHPFQTHSPHSSALRSLGTKILSANQLADVGLSGRVGAYRNFVKRKRVTIANG